MSPGSSPLVAIVDDEASICRALSRLLRSENIRAEAFSNAADFLAWLSQAVPDCVVIDLQMPFMTGLELQQLLIRMDKPPPVIVITAYDSPDVRQRCLDLGVRYYLQKPIEVRTFIDSIRDVVAA